MEIGRVMCHDSSHVGCGLLVVQSWIATVAQKLDATLEEESWEKLQELSK